MLNYDSPPPTIEIVDESGHISEVRHLYEGDFERCERWCRCWNRGYKLKVSASLDCVCACHVCALDVLHEEIHAELLANAKIHHVERPCLPYGWQDLCEEMDMKKPNSYDVYVCVCWKDPTKCQCTCFECDVNKNFSTVKPAKR